MSFLKKFAWSGGATVLAVVMALALLGTSVFAAAPTAGAVSPSTGTAGATANYTFNAVGSANTALTSAAVTFPTNFTVPASPTVTVLGNGATCVVTGATSSGGVVSITIAAIPVCASGTSLAITVNGVTNGPAGTYTASTTQSATAGFAIATSLDTTLVAESNGVVISGGPTSVSFSGASQVAAATTTWTVNFVGSANTNLTSITVKFPTSFTIPATPAVTVTGNGTACTASATAASGTVTITVAGTCATATSGVVTIDGITNPAAGTYTASSTQSATAGFNVSTSLDTGVGVDSANEVISAAAGGTGTCTGGLCVDAFVLTPAGTTCNAAAVVAGTRPGSAVADGSIAYSLCVHVSTASTNNIDSPATFADANDTAANGAVVNLSVSLGVLSTGTSKTTTVITNPTGYATTNYRGGGNQVSTDTAIASAKLGTANAVGSLTINLTAASGGTAAKVAVLAPSVLAVAPNITNVSPQYSSPTIGSDVIAQVTDASGLGVNSQVLLITVDKGYLVADPVFASASANANCAGASAKSLSLTTAGTNLLSRGGTATSGTVNFTFCANQLDAPGKATITVSNVSTTMANATGSISMAGRPAKIDATATGNSITAKVTDKDGNAVADGTPVRFTISSNAGAVSTGCTTSTNGQASSVVALVAATGTVIVSADWNEGGTTATAATCAAAGTQQVATSVTVPGAGGGTGGTGNVPATGVATSNNIPAGGGFGFIVYGGPLNQLATTAGCPVSTSAFWYTVQGNFITYVPGTTITAVNADFVAQFPNGIPSGTPLMGKCK